MAKEEVGKTGDDQKTTHGRVGWGRQRKQWQKEEVSKERPPLRQN
jgi:hypothetical protein